MTVAEYDMYIASIDDMEHRAIDDKEIHSGLLPFPLAFPWLGSGMFYIGLSDWDDQQDAGWGLSALH